MCASHDILKKHDQLEFEEHDRINGGTAFVDIVCLHEFPRKREVKRALQEAVEVILWY